MLTLNVTIYPSSFNDVNDVITIYTGAGDLSVQSTRGFAGTQYRQHSQQQHTAVTELVTVYARAATVNFKSKSIEGKHFELSYTYAYACPPTHHVNTDTDLCELVKVFGTCTTRV